MQMHTGMASHIVLFARVCKEVGLGAGLDTGIEERQTVLWHHCFVVIAGDNLELTL